MSTIQWQDLEPYREMMGDTFVTEILQTYLDNSCVLLNDIVNHFNGQNIPEFTRAAHTLKSNSAMLGAHQLAEICLQLEKAGRSENISSLDTEIEQLKQEHELVCQEIRQKLESHNRSG